MPIPQFKFNSFYIFKSLKMAYLGVFSKFFTPKNACQQYVKIGYKEIYWYFVFAIYNSSLFYYFQQIQSVITADLMVEYIIRLILLRGARMLATGAPFVEC